MTDMFRFVYFETELSAVWFKTALESLGVRCDPVTRSSDNKGMWVFCARLEAPPRKYRITVEGKVSGECWVTATSKEEARSQFKDGNYEDFREIDCWDFEITDVVEEKD